MRLTVLGAGRGLAQERVVVVRAARMLDVERGTIVPDAAVVIEGERIRALGAEAAPAGAETVDRLVGFAETTNAIPGALIEAVHDAYLGDDAMEKGIRIRTSSFTRHHVNVTMCKAKANGKNTLRNAKDHRSFRRQTRAARTRS